MSKRVYTLTEGSSSSRQLTAFSLIELMLAVAIVGILATIAGQAFQRYRLKAKQVEAKTNLYHIYSLQQSYILEFNSYTSSFGYGYNPFGGTWDCAVPAGMQELGFSFISCGGGTPRFRYLCNAAPTNFFCYAIGGGELHPQYNLVVPGCDIGGIPNERWRINPARNLVHDISGCDDF